MAEAWADGEGEGEGKEEGAEEGRGLAGLLQEEFLSATPIHGFGLIKPGRWLENGFWSLPALPFPSSLALPLNQSCT